MKLESVGVILFKDSSTNKGGVISSSLEVLAGMALSDEEHERLMCSRPNGPIPEFRRRFIAETIDHVRDTCDREFELLWKARARGGGVPLSEPL